MVQRNENEVNVFAARLMGELQKDFTTFINNSVVGPKLKKAGFTEAANVTFAAGFASGMKFRGENKKANNPHRKE